MKLAAERSQTCNPLKGNNTYRFTEREHFMTDEEMKLEILRYLNNGCWLADTLHKETTDRITAHENDGVAFFVEKNPYFDFPDADIINEMVRDRLLSVHISPWIDGDTENPRYNLRHFRMTERGRAYYAEHSQDNETE
jgi:hypothetical protein